MKDGGCGVRVGGGGRGGGEVEFSLGKSCLCGTG